MKTINQLPKEILPEILENLDPHDLMEAQKVCRAWYLPAHLLLLRNIHLRSEKEIDEFIKSIDHNLDASYLAAVQEMRIGSDDDFGVNYTFDNGDMEKLFYRFPNLMHVSIHSSLAYLDEFDEESCHTLAKCCPKLNQFELFLNDEVNEVNEVDEEDEEDEVNIKYCRTMYKLRSLVTSIDMEFAGSASEFGGIVKFITSFPRLQCLWGGMRRLFKFQYCFPIFEQLACLQELSIYQDYHESLEEYFAEKQLARLSKEKQNLIIQHFSQVTRLAYRGDLIFCPNAFKFIAKYFTGLESLTIDFYYHHGSWTDYHHQVLLSHMTTFSVKENCDIRLENMPIPIVAECLSAVENNLFSQFLSNRGLKVVLLDKYLDKDTIDLRLQWPTTKQITVSFEEKQENYDTLTTLLNSQLANVDQLVFHIEEKLIYRNAIDINTYTTLLRALPMLKEAALDIPPSFTDSIPCAEICQCTHMETLTLRGSFRVTMQNMLDSFAVIFPNLKTLILYNYTGVNAEGTRDFYINLTNYSLELLVLDMTPFYLTTMKERSIKSGFFGVQIATLERKERYRILADFSSVTKIEYDDGQDDWWVHIIVNSLKRLEAYVCNIDELNIPLWKPRYSKQIVVF